MNKGKLELLHPLIDDLIRRETDPGEIHVCPICKGRLHVSMQILTEFDLEKKKVLGIGIRCEDCKTTAFFQDGYIPPWAKESEHKITSLKDALDELGKDTEEE
jgi:hypothetical protein